MATMDQAIIDHDTELEMQQLITQLQNNGLDREEALDSIIRVATQLRVDLG